LVEVQVAQLTTAVEQAKAQDRSQYEMAIAAHKEKAAEVKQLREMAARILAGDVGAYAEVMDEIDLCASPLLGRQVVYSFPDSSSAEVFAYLNASDAIPADTKKLLSSGRVSEKKRTKRDFALFHQDHVCSVVLRLGRDFLGRLPIKAVVVHGFVPGIDSATGQSTERCVVSCILHREAMERIEFNRVDPSDCVSSFPSAMRISRGVLAEVDPVEFHKAMPKTVANPDRA
jgi:hypothetical protein